MKKTLLLLLSILSLNIVFAQQFVENGIKYNVTSSTVPLTVEVIANAPIYSGAIIIPKTVTNDEITYAVTAIGDSAFHYCYKLTSISIPNSVTSIGANAFYACSGLTSVSLPNSVTSIGQEVFRSCSGLTSVSLPNSITSMGWGSFTYCTALTSVSVNVPDPTSIALSSFVFYDVPFATATLTVPVGSETAYSNAPQWKDFTNIVGGTLSTNDVVLEKSFSVYPNPVQNTLFIKQNKVQELQKVSVYNTLGKQVLNSTNNTVDVSGLSSGLYVVKITTAAGSITKKMLKN